MINPYNYESLKDGYNCTLKEESSLWSCYTVDFPSAHSLQYLGSNRIKGEYYFPKGLPKAPLAILIHGMGDRSVVPCRLIAHTLAKKGIASFVLFLVFHRNRVPDSIKGKYPKLSDEEWFESYQLSVVDIRQIIDWAGTRDEISGDKIAVIGISFGGFISAIAMALENRIKAGIFIVTGGNSEKITRHSFLLRRVYKPDPEEYLKNQESYFRYLTEVKEKGFEKVTASKNSYLTDPLTFANNLRGRPVLMLNALWDEMIPRVATVDLWKYCGEPALNWYPASHASIWLWYPIMGRRIISFLKMSLRLT
jgi:cephalosporin-C deacetylase-like acetyl esterase